MRNFHLKQFAAKHKYNARRVEVDGIKFASAHEAKTYQSLKLAQSCGAVKKIELQVPFILNIPTKYVADFRVTYNDGRVEIVDDKGFKTDVYKRKKKYMKLQHGIDIVEV